MRLPTLHKDDWVALFIVLLGLASIFVSLYFLPGCTSKMSPRMVAQAEGIGAGGRRVGTAVPCPSPSCPVEALDDAALKAYMVEVVK